jgi:hypothetical protein
MNNALQISERFEQPLFYHSLLAWQGFMRGRKTFSGFVFAHEQIPTLSMAS